MEEELRFTKSEQIHDDFKPLYMNTTSSISLFHFVRQALLQRTHTRLRDQSVALIALLCLFIDHRSFTQHLVNFLPTLLTISAS